MSKKLLKSLSYKEDNGKKAQRSLREKMKEQMPEYKGRTMLSKAMSKKGNKYG